MMEVFKFIILTWLASFIPAAYCRMENSSSELICNITIYQEDGTFPGAIAGEWQSKMIDSCPENYTNQDIIASCERFYTKKDIDRDLFAPQTSDITNITYINTYCGYCNNENETNWGGRYWNSWDRYRYLESACVNYTSEIRASEIDDLDKWVQTFVSDGMILETRSYRRKLQCFGEKNWPVNLLYHVIPCLIEGYMYGQYDRLNSCRYFDKNDRSCMSMGFIIEGFYFDYRNKSYDHLSQINLTGGDYVVQTGNDDVFYLCEQIYKVGYWGKFSLIIASVAFLLIYLILNLNKHYFQSLPNQLLYIYSVGLIVMYGMLTYIYLRFPMSYVSFHIAKIFWTYHFIWVTMILIVFCHVAFSMCKRRENKSEKDTTIFYLSILFLFGLLLPISLPIMYLNFLKSHENQCPLIPGHLAFTDISSENLQFMNFILNSSLAFFMPVVFVVGIFCIGGNVMAKDEGRRSARYTENAPTVILKMLLIMGINWILYKLCTGYYGNENSYTFIGLAINMDTMAQLSFDIHGVLIFFIFLTDNAMIIDILNKYAYKRENTIQQDATETSVQLQSSDEIEK